MTVLFTEKELCPKPCTSYSLYYRVPFSSMLPEHELYEHPLWILLHKGWKRSALLTLTFFCSCFEVSVSFIEVDSFGWRSTFLPKLSFFPICSVVERASPWQGSSRKTGVAAPKQFLPTASSDPPQILKCSNAHILQRWSDAKILGCCNTRLLKYSLNIRMLRSCKEARMFRCSNA